MNQTNQNNSKIENEETSNSTSLDETIHNISQHLHNNEKKEAAYFFLQLSITDQADVIEGLDNNGRLELIEICEKNINPSLYTEIVPEARKTILESLSPQKVAKIIADLESDDALDLIAKLDEEHQETIIKKLSTSIRTVVEEGLNFPEESAGRLMQRETVAIPQFWTVGKTLDYFRATAGHLPEDFHTIYIVDPRHHLVGEILTSRLLSASRSTKLKDLTSQDIFSVKAETDQEDVAYLFQKEHLFSAPVVDINNRLIGTITADDVMNVIQKELQEDTLKLAGISNSSDIYKAVIDTTKSRFSWLLINLFTAILASLVIGLFSATLEQIVALAVLMPIVASMGGNAGTQTLTIAVRSLATKELSSANAWRFIGKETAIGFLNGILFAVLVFLVSWFWFESFTLGLVIGVAMIVNMILAGLFGIAIPITLDKMNIDPALASSVFLTTVTDVVGFFAFLGLAALFLV